MQIETHVSKYPCSRCVRELSGCGLFLDLRRLSTEAPSPNQREQKSSHLLKEETTHWRTCQLFSRQAGAITHREKDCLTA